MARRAIRFSEKTDKEIQEATQKRGFSSPSAFIRHSVEQELSGRNEELIGAEERLVANIERARQEVFRLGRAQQALFSLLDSLARVVLTCLPEPGGEAMEAAVARARGRHARRYAPAPSSPDGIWSRHRLVIHSASRPIPSPFIARGIYHPEMTHINKGAFAPERCRPGTPGCASALT